MSEVINIVEELRQIHFSDDAWHGPGLSKILRDVSSESASARPLEGYGSIWELVLHISKWEEVFCSRLEGREMNLPEEGDWPPLGNRSKSDWEQVLKTFDATHNRLIEIVSEFSGSNLEKIVAGKDYSIAFMLHGIVRHHVYHSGQIALLKRLPS